MKNKKLIEDKNGLLTVNIPPSKRELDNFYKNIYFQEIPSKSFKKKYSQDEIKFNELNFKLANLFFKKYHKSILDVGCGEGYLLKFFDKLNYKCHGVDYSTYGIKNQNPKLCAVNFYTS